jgi:hypothetical protein
MVRSGRLFAKRLDANVDKNVLGLLDREIRGVGKTDEGDGGRVRAPHDEKC